MKSVLPEGVDMNCVDIWFQDESRVGQQGSMTRVWHLTGLCCTNGKGLRNSVKCRDEDD